MAIVIYKGKTMLSGFFDQVAYYLSEIAFDVYNKETLFPLRNPIFLIVFFTAIALADPNLINHSASFWNKVISFFIYSIPALIVSVKTIGNTTQAGVAGPSNADDPMLKNREHWTNKHREFLKREEMIDDEGMLKERLTLKERWEEFSNMVKKHTQSDSDVNMDSSRSTRTVKSTTDAYDKKSSSSRQTTNETVIGKDKNVDMKSQRSGSKSIDGMDIDNQSDRSKQSNTTKNSKDETQKETKRIAEEEANKKRISEETEKRRKAEEVEKQRKVLEAERKIEEASKKRVAEETEKRRKTEEVDKQRKVLEAERKTEEANKKRNAEETEKRRKADEENKQRNALESGNRRNSEDTKLQKKSEEIEKRQNAEEVENRKRLLESGRRGNSDEVENRRKPKLADNLSPKDGAVNSDKKLENSENDNLKNFALPKTTVDKSNVLKDRLSDENKIEDSEKKTIKSAQDESPDESIERRPNVCQGQNKDGSAYVCPRKFHRTKHQ